MNRPLRLWHERDDRLLRLRLDRPKANIVDAAMIAALADAIATATGGDGLTAVLLDAEGPHFSFGASVEEHLPERCADMLAGLHTLIRQMLDCPVPILVAIRGQCLGGGLELAAAGHLLFAAPDAQFGQPEIKLGVFAPAASCLLPERIGQGAAEDLLYSGRSISGEEAWRLGLVNESPTIPRPRRWPISTPIWRRAAQARCALPSRRPAPASRPVSRPGSTPSSGSTSTA
jgi:cyclohexa-1,5-dienecarbonyl-CoA hydratase